MPPAYVYKASGVAQLHAEKLGNSTPLAHRMKKKNLKRVYQRKMWEAAKFYCKDADKSYKAKAYFSVLVARASELEALLRISDFVETRKPKDRCHSFKGLVDRAFAKHGFRTMG